MKKIILLVFLLIFIPVLSVSAAPVKKPEIIVQNDAIPMDQNALNEFRDEILAEYPNAKKIEILGYNVPISKISSGESYKIQEKSNNVFDNIIGKKATQIVVSTQNIVSTYSTVSKDELAFTIEKGGSKTLSKDFTTSIKATFNGTPFSEEQLGASIVLSGTFEKNIKFLGPEDTEESFSTREFRVRLYQEDGHYVQTKRTLFNVGKATEEVAHGEYAKPTKVILYSIDFS